MNYRNTEMKLDQLINYVNEEKINLSPAFQRGHVWPLNTRRKLVANIVEGRPIPAIFLYKEAAGSRYSYNILDGKQRLESLILFVGAKRQDLKIANWNKYFFSPSLRGSVDFWIQLKGGKRRFRELEEQVIREFREYAIPTVEINLTDDSHLDEIISLFVDINQQGVAVKRFDIVKAMGDKNALLRSVFELLAIQQRRAQDVFYKSKTNDFTHVLKTLEIVAVLTDPKSQVDRMWERLLEIALYVRERTHRKPVDILKSFIRARGIGDKGTERMSRLAKPERLALEAVFRFLAKAYKTSTLDATPLAKELTYFYTMITALIGTDLLATYSAKGLTKRLVRFGKMIDGKVPTPDGDREEVVRFLDLASDRTTDTPRREERERIFLKLLKA